MTKSFLLTIRGTNRSWSIVAELESAGLASALDVVSGIVEISGRYNRTVRDRRCWLSTGETDTYLYFWAPKEESDMMEADGVKIDAEIISDLEDYGEEDKCHCKGKAPNYSLN